MSTLPHVLRCADCGAERRSAKPPGSLWAPSRCKDCARIRSRIGLALTLRRPLLPTDARHGYQLFLAKRARLERARTLP